MTALPIVAVVAGSSAAWLPGEEPGAVSVDNARASATAADPAPAPTATCPSGSIRSTRKGSIDSI